METVIVLRDSSLRMASVRSVGSSSSSLEVLRGFFSGGGSSGSLGTFSGFLTAVRIASSVGKLPPRSSIPRTMMKSSGTFASRSCWAAMMKVSSLDLLRASWSWWMTLALKLMTSPGSSLVAVLGCLLGVDLALDISSEEVVGRGGREGEREISKFDETQSSLC